MKISSGILAAAAMWALGGCATAPTDTVTCSTSPAITVTGQGVTSALVVQSWTYIDTGTPNSVGLALNNEDVKVISDLPELVTICPGNCDLASGTFGPDVTVETDKDGVLIYTLRLNDKGTATGTIFEEASGEAPTTCSVSVTMS